MIEFFAWVFIVLAVLLGLATAVLTFVAGWFGLRVLFAPWRSIFGAIRRGHQFPPSGDM